MLLLGLVADLVVLDLLEAAEITQEDSAGVER